jgi:hypothetical protein
VRGACELLLCDVRLGCSWIQKFLMRLHYAEVCGTFDGSACLGLG